jgi:plastocyanin
MMQSSTPFSVPIITIALILILASSIAPIGYIDYAKLAHAQSLQPLIAHLAIPPGEETIVQQGIVTSSQDPLPGHEEHQRATILPFRPDGSVYSGVLTYTATEPVQLVILDMQTLNTTERTLLDAAEDELETELLTSQLDNETSIVISIITPEYGDTPVPSASIPFAGNVIWLHTLDGEPFTASYTVTAQVLPSEIQNNISSPAEITTTVSPEDDEEDLEDVDSANTTDMVNAEEAEDEAVEEAEDEAVEEAEDEAVEEAEDEAVEEAEDEAVEEAEDETAATTPDEENDMSSNNGNTEAQDDDGGGSAEFFVSIPQGSSSFTDDAYVPNPVEINVGDTVTWINDDFTTHTATSGTPDSGSTSLFGGTQDSPEIIGPEGDTQSFTFDEEGEYPYYCTLHPNMVGTVMVTEG